MQTVQSSILVLYTSLLVAGTNRYGTANTNFTDVTFTNVNMRQILGDNFNKYYKFNLILNSVALPTTTSNILTNNDCLVMLYMSGLNFDGGCCYSTITGYNSSTSYIGSIRTSNRGNPGTFSDLITFPPTFFNTFLRCEDMPDITISLRSPIATLTGGVPTFLLPTANLYPKLTYTFSIVPVLDTEILPFPSQTEQSLVNKQRLFTK
jgi:hypothetical protein